MGDQTRPFPNEEPDAGMRTMAKAFRGMYVALVQEGFSHQDAMGMVSTALAEAMRSIKPPS